MKIIKCKGKITELEVEIGIDNPFIEKKLELALNKFLSKYDEKESSFDKTKYLAEVTIDICSRKTNRVKSTIESMESGYEILNYLFEFIAKDFIEELELLSSEQVLDK